MPSIIVGTAGHIDHGKSALVLALTGKDPDRLPEEKRRGITIDLGFADLQLDDTRIGFVDVPGHERFIKNMLAGVHGIDLVALVIAADEGVMPQTREHFDICRLLGVSKGLVVITKKDLADQEMLELVKADAEELTAGSFLQNAPVVSVSARTGEGLEELKVQLRQLAATVGERSTDFVARLPIDRVFTMKGFGAVVTGTLISGELSVGEELELLPPAKRVRVRGLQVHGNAVATAVAGQRTAVNLAGVDVEEIERGMMLADSQCLSPTQVLDVQLTLLPTAKRSIRTRSRVRFHIGSTEVLARVRILNTTNEIAAGQSGFAQLRLESPVVALHHERFIIRSYSPPDTVGGGIVLDPHATKHRGRDRAKTSARLEVLLAGEPAARIAEFVKDSGNQGLRRKDIVARTGWRDEVVARVSKEAADRFGVLDVNGVLIAKDIYEELTRAVVSETKAHYKREPLSRGLSRETLRERRFAHAAPEVFRGVILDLERSGALVVEKEIVRVPEHGRQLSADDHELKQKLAAVYKKAGLAAPSIDEALAQSGVSPAQRTHARKVLQLLLDQHSLVRVQPDMLFSAEAIGDLKERLKSYAATHEPDRFIDVAQFKDLAGVSRKFAIPLLEYFDSERVTVRAGERRKILK